jgi:hypothetical protein
MKLTGKPVDPRDQLALAGRMPDPFRTVVRSCALCGIEAEADSLQSLAGVPVCAVCRGGDLDRALVRNRLTCTAKEICMDGAVSRRTVEVVRPTDLVLAVKLDPDTPRGWLRRLLGASDPEVGDPAFDDQVKVQPADESFTELALAVLRDEGVRQAVLELTACGCKVELAGRTVWASTDNTVGWRPFPELAAFKPLAVALAVAVERFARGVKP